MNFDLRKKLFLWSSLVYSLVFIFFTLSSCKSRNENISQARSFQHEFGNSVLSANGEVLWKKYLESLGNKDKYQEYCFPRRYKVPSNTLSKGIVLLYHGFTACPQQFFEISEKLANEGYEVLLPLNVGHGRVRKVKGIDNVEGLPEPSNVKQVVTDFVDTMNAIMLEASGTKAVGGLSQGAAQASWADQRKPGLYNFVFLATPLLQLSNVAARILGDISGFANSVFPPLVAKQFEKPAGWGEGCEKEIDKEIAVKAGRTERHGICNFKQKHGIASQIFGEHVVWNAKETKAKVQFVVVESDPVASNVTAKKLANKLGLNSTSNKNVSYCVYPKPANHSLFSRVDSPEENKFWLESLLASSIEFLSTGKKFEVVPNTFLEEENVCK